MRKLFIFLLIVVGCGETPVAENNETAPSKDVNAVQHNAVFQTQIASDLNEKGLKLAHRGDYEEARKEFLTALKYEEKNAALLNNLGLVEKAMDNVEDAAVYFEKSIAADSTYYSAYSNYGLLLYEKKEYKKSMDLLHKVINHCNNKIVLASAYLHAAFNYSATGACEKAREYFDKSRQFTKNDRSYDEQSASFEEELKNCK